MKPHNKKFFYTGLVLYFLIITFAPGKIFYFGAYIISTIFFYKATKDVISSLVYSLILAFFSDVGLAGRYFQLQPEGLDLGAGYVITPMTVLSSILLILTFNKPFPNYNLADKSILLFLGWCFIFYLFFPVINIYYGILNLAETVTAYFLLRSNLTRKSIAPIIIIISGLVIFELIFGMAQLFRHGNLGLIAESSVIDNPYGITTIEEGNVLRISGTFGHPNLYASFLVTFFPFVYYLLNLPAAWDWLKALVSIPLLFSFSRLAWAVFILQGIYLGFQAKLHKLRNYSLKKINIFLLAAGASLIAIVLLPFFASRIESLPQVFTEGGSVNVRIKLIQEALNLFGKYPVTGVGLNYSLIAYIVFKSTDLFSQVKPGRFFQIHNLFLEILTEAGIIGLGLFLIFLINIIYTNRFSFRFKDETAMFKKATVIALISLTAISLFNPFFHSSQFRIFLLLGSFLLI